MNKKQKSLIANLISTVVIISLFIFGFGNFKDYINKREAIRGFNQLGQKIIEYRKHYGQLPGESSIEGLKEQVEGGARVGNIHYRAQWIGINSPPNTIVAYAEKEYNWLIGSGVVVLLLDGQILYLTPKEFHELLAKQQTLAETEEMKKSQTSGRGF
jgi:hypothetical protein